MKKVFALMAVFAMVGFVSCSKNDDNKQEEQKQEEKAVTATITASDVTVEEGKTVQIGATTNSSAAITYASSDASIATVSAAGEVAGVKAGSANITLKVAEVAGKFTAAEKTIKVTVTAAATPEPPKPNTAIEIDGDFADWSALADGTYSKSVSDPDAPWDAVKEIRCYADPDHVFYYIKYDAETLADLLTNDKEILAIRLCINTDGEFTTGYANYFLEAYDFIIEGALAENKAFTTYDGEFHQRIDGSWNSLAATGVGLVTGTGAGNEYEIVLDRAIFNEYANTSSVPMPMGDEFQTDIRFYFINENGKWDELSNMPNSSVDEEMGNGWGYLMRIHTNK